MEINQYFVVHVFADMHGRPGIDYSIVFCPSSETVFEKKGLGGYQDTVRL